jgi:hypothetical protein
MSVPFARGPVRYSVVGDESWRSLGYASVSAEYTASAGIGNVATVLSVYQARAKLQGNSADTNAAHQAENAVFSGEYCVEERSAQPNEWLPGRASRPIECHLPSCGWHFSEATKTSRSCWFRAELVVMRTQCFADSYNTNFDAKNLSSRAQIFKNRFATRSANLISNSCCDCDRSSTTYRKGELSKHAHG